MTEFLISFRDCFGERKVDSFIASGYKSAIRKAIKEWKEDIIHLGGSRVQFAAEKEYNPVRFYDVYFEWTENGAFRCYRLERA